MIGAPFTRAELDALERNVLRSGQGWVWFQAATVLRLIATARAERTHNPEPRTPAAQP